MENRTIAAISTPAGAGGIGVIRISGQRAVEIAEKVFSPFGAVALSTLGGYRGLLGKVYDNGTPVDEAIAFVYRAPKSYTGEDVVELSCHGGSYIMSRVLDLCLNAGACLAEPGEFTKRAFLNGKLTLDQAEAVMDLIQSGNEAARITALRSKEGRITGAINAFEEKLTAISAKLAAWTDYPEEDLEEVDPADLAVELSHVLAEMNRLLDTWEQGRIIRNGIHAVLAGRPNVGKSTLMNLLAGDQRSIVTDIPGTTRDVIEDQVQVGKYMLNLSDTAGLRNTDNPVEQLGVKMARDRLDSADLVFMVFDASERVDDQELALLESLRGRKVILIVNKMDLAQAFDESGVADFGFPLVYMSAGIGEGKQDLQRAIEDMFELGLAENSDIMTNERQKNCLKAAVTILREALDALKQGVTLDAVNVGIDSALEKLMELTGKNVTEQVLNEVFSKFCVGK